MYYLLLQRGRRSKWFVECQQTSGNERYNLQVKLKKWPIGHINSFGNNNHKNKHYRVTHKINGHCSGHIPQLRDFFKHLVLPEIESFLYLYVFTVKLHIKTGFISKSFFFLQNILGEYSNVTQLYPWRQWLWQL